MGRANKEERPHRIGFHFPDRGGFVAVTMEHFESEAFQTLNGSELQAFLWMLKKYHEHKDCRFEKGDLSDKGFIFTYKDVESRMDEKTFDKARIAICERGFFECLPDKQPTMPGHAKIFVPSRKWRDWRDESGKLAKHKQTKQARRARKQRDFLDRPRKAPTSRQTAPEVATPPTNRPKAHKPRSGQHTSADGVPDAPAAAISTAESLRAYREELGECDTYPPPKPPAHFEGQEKANASMAYCNTVTRLTNRNDER